MEKYNYYRTPAELAESGKPTKAILYSMIESLQRKKGYCWASNSFLAKRMGFKNPGNISKYVQELKREGWIKTKINGTRREIWLLRDYSGKTIDSVRNNGCLPSEIPEESIIKSNINSNINNLRKYNLMKKEFINKSKFK